MRYVLTAVLVLLLATMALGQDAMGVKNKMMISGYGGYTLGFGDAFFDESYEEDGITVEASFKPSINFGGMFHYGLAEKIMLGGELGFQSYKLEGSVMGYSADESSTEMNILGSLLYTMNYDPAGDAFYLMAGAGLYGGFDDFGVNGGIMYSKKLGDKLKGFVMPRFHMLFSDPSAMMLSLSAGISFPLGE